MFNIPANQVLEKAEERLSYSAFFRKFNKFRISDLNPRFIPFPEDFQLPQNSVLHLWDNMYSRDNNLPLVDTPYLDIPFIKNDPFRKYIYHLLGPNVTDVGNPIILPNDYVYRTMNLSKNLMGFRRDNGSKFRYMSSLEEMSASSNTLTLLNYNPLFRVFTRGILPVYRQFKVILGTILNTASKIKGKNQYIIVPLSHQIYTRDKFRMSERMETTSAIKSPNSFHYFFMMHWLNFISTVSDLSLFEKFPQDQWAELNVMFTVGSKDFRYGMIWSLHDAANLNENNKLYPRYVNQINALILADMGTEITTEETAETEIDQVVTEKKIVTETTAQEIKTQAPPEDDTDVTLTEEEQHEIEEQNEIEKHIIDIFSVNKPTVPLQVNAAPMNIPTDYSAVTVEIPKEIEEEEEIPVVTDTQEEFETLASEPTHGKLNEVTPIKTSKEVSESGKRFLDSIEEDVHQLLLTNTTLTPKQKERIKNLSMTSRQIKFNGKTLEEHLTAPIDPNTHSNELDFLKDHLPDQSMITSSLKNFDDQYMKNFFERDLVSVALSLNKNGMILTGIEEQLHSDELNRVRRFKFSYQDIHGKSHTVKFDVPHIDEDGVCLINGVRCTMRKQMANLPICKVSPVRVSLASNYNKTVVERNEAKAHSFLAYFQRLINKINDVPEGKTSRVEVEYGSTKVETTVAYEYSSIASTYKSLKFIDPKGLFTRFFFDFENRLALVPDKYQKDIQKLETKYGVFCGITQAHMPKGIPSVMFIHPTNIITLYNLENTKDVKRTTFLDMISGMYEVKLSSPLSEWTDIKILDKKFPVGFLLCYQFGLQHVLRYLNVKYTLYEKRKRYTKRTSDIVIPFKDKVLVIPRYPLRNSLIMAGLLMFSTNKYLMEDFEQKDVYYQMLIDKGPGFRTNYLKGIEDTFALFVDPITRDVLEQMNEPTNFKDLLIRATDMLVTEDHYEASSMRNHRLRSYERINAIVYNEMARQFAAYHRKAGGGTPFSINPNAVLQRILQDQAMVGVEDINPIHEIKVNTGFTYSGMGGRTSQSFVVNDRRYPKDALGIISEATADSQSVAITAIAPADPTVANVRGILEIKDPSELEPTQLLSTVSLLMPGATQDDSKRANFISIQLSHQLPTKEGSCSRIRTGYERVIAHRVSNLYSYPAEQDGKVIEINQEAGMCKIQYKDGSIHTFQFGELYGECADMVTTQKLELTVKVGDKFNRGDILCYNPQFFELDPTSRQVDWKHGVPGMVAIMDCAGTFEDSNIITKRFGDKLEIEPVQLRAISFNANTFVHDVKKVGDQVDINDFLIVFEDATMTDLSSVTTDDVALDYLAKLNRVTPKAKFTGEIVKIEVFYSCPLSEMHPTLSKVVKDIIRTNNAKNKFSQGTSSSAQYPPSQPLPEGTKFKKVKFEKDTVVFRFFIKETITAGVGDKIVFDSSLKSVVGVVIDDIPTTESGVEIDAVFSGSSISNRIVNSPILVGVGERVLERLEESAIDMYFKK